jgi:hypothetical protein
MTGVKVTPLNYVRRKETSVFCFIRAISSLTPAMAVLRNYVKPRVSSDSHHSLLGRYVIRYVPGNTCRM